jgi:hypothetical protein
MRHCSAIYHRLIRVPESHRQSTYRFLFTSTHP